MSKKLIGVAVVAVVAVALLAGCSLPGPSAPAPAITKAPSLDSEAQEFADAVCGVLDSMGVVSGVPAMYELALDRGFTESEITDLLSVSIVTTCPEYVDDIERAVG